MTVLRVRNVFSILKLRCPWILRAQLKILDLLWKSQPESLTLDESVVCLRWRQNTPLGPVINQLQSCFFRGRDHFWKGHTYKLGNMSIHSHPSEIQMNAGVPELIGTRVWGQGGGMLSAPFRKSVPAKSHQEGVEHRRWSAVGPTGSTQNQTDFLCWCLRCGTAINLSYDSVISLFWEERQHRLHVACICTSHKVC